MGILRHLAASAALVSLAAPAAAQPGGPAPVDARMDAVLAALQPPAQVAGRSHAGQPLAEMMRHYRVPAVSIAYVEDGRIVWVRAFGAADVAARRAATPTTMFQAASISKPVAATAALALVERGRLQLDAPVNPMLASWDVPDNELTRDAPVTLRHLLTHTAGLTVHGFPGYDRTAALPTLLQILDGLPPSNTPAVRVDQRPGSAWRYSGGGYTVLQQLMSDVAGRPFPELMNRLVLRPARMRNSRFGPLDPARARTAASGYRSDGAAIAAGHMVHPELAAAGLWSTPSDLARWALAVTAAYHGRSSRPISPASARAMLTSGQGNWGLGLPVDREGEWLRFSHGGSNQGFRANLVFFPRRREGIVVMTNSDNGHLLFTAIIQAVGRSRGWPDSAPHLVNAVAVPASALADAVGRYASPDVQAEIVLAGDRLTMSLQGGPASELVPQAVDRYILLDLGLEVTADRDPASGRVVSISGAGITLARVP